jgi:hypothetical protein
MTTQTSRRKALNDIVSVLRSHEIELPEADKDARATSLAQELVNIFRPEMSATAKSLLGLADPALNKKLKAEQDMRERVERAVKKNPDWFSPRSEWEGYEKKLMKREKETGQTIEQFMVWYRSDEFRAKNDLWLKPSRIEEFWQRAFEEKKEETAPAYQKYTPEKYEGAVPRP